MKKLVAFIGSPRKGETLSAVKRLEEEMNKKEEVAVEYIMLSDIGLGECTGCHNCITRGREFCRENKRVRELQDKMIKADGVILATPVYNQHVTSIFKKFMDYYTFLWHRPEMFGIKFFGISSGGGMFKDVFKYMKMNVDSWGGTWIGSLGVPHYESLTDKFKGKVDNEISKKSVMLLRALEAQTLPSPSMGRLIMFNIWRMNAVATRKSIAKDYEYWMKQNWLNTDYYYKAKIGIHKRIIVGLITRLARSQMRKIYNGY